MTPWGIIFALPLLAYSATPPAADEACAQCHRRESAGFHASAMARALEPVSGCEILQQHPSLAFEEGAFHSRIVRQGDRSILTVTDGTETLTVPLLWAFGRGKAGQTYVFEHKGNFYESRISFFNVLGALDLTMGARGSHPRDLEEAAGRRMDAIDARDCFGCHSAGGVSGGRLHLETMTPGLACESCHGPTGQHLAAVRSGDAVAARMPKLSASPAEDMSELCGKCHRTWSEIAMKGPRGINNVRFQPYRLTNSKCYDPTDTRIRCSACHDPHSPLEATTASYDVKCAACHSAAAHTRTCPVAKANCVTCHMPRFDLPGAHARFTDHQIRIVRPGDPYPN